MPKTPKPQRPNKGQYANKPEEALDRASSDLLRKVPPHSLEAEQAVLGGVFQSEHMFHQLVDIISDQDFYSPVHRDIFKAFIQLYDTHQPIDVVTVANQLAKNDTLGTVGGPVYLAELSDSVISASNALHHAQIVRDKCILRQLIDISSGIISNCFSSRDVDEVLDESEKEIFQIAQSKEMRGMLASGQLVPKVFEELTARFNNKSVVTGIQTHYHDFDAMTAGLQKSDLIIIAGRPSMGKTAFALNVALRAAVRSECPTAIFSLEMSMEQLMTRLLAVQCKVELSNLRTGYLDDQDWLSLHEGGDVLTQAPIFIDDTPALSTLELQARCRRLKAEHNLGLVVVDYLQLMRSSARPDSREQEISDISRHLKALAKELDVPVIALSQLNRKVEERTDKRPMMSDLRESGAIEQDADIIIFLYRDAAYNKSEDNPLKNHAEVIIGKQRNGPTGRCELFFKKEYTLFENMDATAYPSELPQGFHQESD
ncbi:MULTISPECIES: replicative DNA helicase [unclassified Pseudodesulfovibrio]|uniref:replicative DNA helicase n=1 Tax=unclassified Pseudodesulfovibrio TaxID=2661612 RepID=UPI000FEBA447|nr:MULTISPECIES: replicative DNA helicase [unclassified Pseudodesulfovibrio]MCJ2164280.1 replicative DNA helicase [Pseudodesulfovibrio sp. S3-i]RWU05098.1 replicative DNA helicase [Pseudodesulfovibrio sp. S3]